MNPTDPIPSRSRAVAVSVVEPGIPLTADALAVPVASGTAVPQALGVDLAALARAGFTPQVGAALAFPAAAGPVLVAVGVGPVDALSAARVRDAAAAFARAVPADARLACRVPASTALLDAGQAAAAIVEGVLLARYRYSLKSVEGGPVEVSELTLEAPSGESEAVGAGAIRGLATARAAMLGRDLAASPAGLLTATKLAEVAVRVGSESDLEVAVHDRESITALGLGGLLGVNKGSVQEPRLIVLRYRPPQPTGHLALVGKGIMYDSGGINLKPGDLSHSQMKNDMTGAGDILAAMSALAELGATAAVTGYLMCTDNMPSGSALQLGDVLTIRGGKTVEVLNTDAEGRLVLADGLVLAVESGVDAIVDIATLTGACLRTLGEEVAGLLGNNDDLADQLLAAGDQVDEPLWRLPLVRSYRAELDSDIADLKNLGGPNAGSITAALFLEEFVAGVPWAHLDIAGTAQSSRARSWTNRGPTAFGTRLLLQTALDFRPPAA